MCLTSSLEVFVLQSHFEYVYMFIGIGGSNQPTKSVIQGVFLDEVDLLENLCTFGNKTFLRDEIDKDTIVYEKII